MEVGVFANVRELSADRGNFVEAPLKEVMRIGKHYFGHFSNRCSVCNISKDYDVVAILREEGGKISMGLAGFQALM